MQTSSDPLQEKLAIIYVSACVVNVCPLYIYATEKVAYMHYLSICYLLIMFDQCAMLCV